MVEVASRCGRGAGVLDYTDAVAVVTVAVAAVAVAVAVVTVAVVAVAAVAVVIAVVAVLVLVLVAAVAAAPTISGALASARDRLVAAALGERLVGGLGAGPLAREGHHRAMAVDLDGARHHHARATHAGELGESQRPRVDSVLVLRLEQRVPERAGVKLHKVPPANLRRKRADMARLVEQARQRCRASRRRLDGGRLCSAERPLLAAPAARRAPSVCLLQQVAHARAAVLFRSSACDAEERSRMPQAVLLDERVVEGGWRPLELEGVGAVVGCRQEPHQRPARPGHERHARGQPRQAVRVGGVGHVRHRAAARPCLKRHARREPRQLVARALRVERKRLRLHARLALKRHAEGDGDGLSRCSAGGKAAVALGVLVVHVTDFIVLRIMSRRYWGT